jgi:hypothetical protein
MQSPSCLHINVSPLLTFKCLIQSLWNLVCISWQLSPYERRNSEMPPISLCVCMCIPPYCWQATARWTRSFCNEYTQQQKNYWTRHFLCGPCLIKGESVDLCIPLSLLGNGSVNKFPWQRGIVLGVVFYVVRVVSKESRKSVLPRTSRCLYLNGKLGKILMSGQRFNPTFHSYIFF